VAIDKNRKTQLNNIVNPLAALAQSQQRAVQTVKKPVQPKIKG
jgi:hypothetical protein